MATIVTRAGKGSALTWTEVDANFTNLNTAKAELSGATFTGPVDLTANVNLTGNIVAAGASITPAELSFLDNVSSNIQTQLNGKQATLNSGTNIKTVGGVSLLGAGDVGTIGVAYGGTGVASLTSGYLIKGNGTSALSASAVFESGGSVGIGTSSPIGSAGYGWLTINGSSAGAATSYSIAGTENFRIQSTSSFTGLNQITALPMLFYTSNTERMRIDSSGNVGIGTSSPASTLEVASNISSSIFSTNYSDNTAGGNYVGRKGRGTSSAPTGVLADDQLAVVLGRGYTSAGSFSGNVGAIGIYAAETFTATNNGSYVAFATTATGATSRSERMRIDSSGNVGIGASPLTRLDVATSGGSRIRTDTSSSLLVTQTITNAAANAYVTSRTDAYDYQFYTGGSQKVVIDSSGNVGIGTSSPGQKLDVAGSVRSSGYFIGATGTGGFAGLSTDGTVTGGGTVICRSATSTYNTAGLELYTGGSERMRITSAGSWLIGTTALAAANWANEIKNTTTDAWPLALNATTRGMVIRNSSATSGFYTYFEYNSGTNNGSISWSGGTTFYNTTSDARIKENIVDAPEASDLIDAIKVRSWDFKADGVHWRYGMVAQELLDVVPEAVAVPEDPEMMMGVDYAKLVPMLIKEVQSLRARVAQLEGK